MNEIVIKKKNPKVWCQLAQIAEENGMALYAVGGTLRAGHELAVAVDEREIRIPAAVPQAGMLEHGRVEKQHRAGSVGDLGVLHAGQADRRDARVTVGVEVVAVAHELKVRAGCGGKTGPDHLLSVERAVEHSQLIVDVPVERPGHDIVE